MMQNEISRIIEQVEQLYTSNNWVGFNLDELLNCITDQVPNFKLSLINNNILLFYLMFCSNFLNLCFKLLNNYLSIFYLLLSILLNFFLYDEILFRFFS